MPPKKNSPKGMQERRELRAIQQQAQEQARRALRVADVFPTGLPMGVEVGATRNPRGPRPRPQPTIRNPNNPNTPELIRLRTIQGQITPEMRAAREAAGANLPPRSPPPEFKQGGKVKKTGLALVHKGEVVVPATRVKTVDRALKQAGLKPLKK